MLVVQGTEDVVALPENVKRLAAEFPERGTLVELRHGGMLCCPSNRSKSRRQFWLICNAGIGERSAPDSWL